jgi:hypothetical protein
MVFDCIIQTAFGTLPFDTAISNPIFTNREQPVSTCMPIDSNGAVAEYVVRIKTAPFVEKINDDGTKNLDDSGTRGTPFIRLHGSTSNPNKDLCSNWIKLKTGFTPGKSYEFAMFGPDVGQVKQVDLKNESDDTWLPEVLAVKRLTTKMDPWSEFLLGQPLGGKEFMASFLPNKIDKLTIVDKKTGLIKLADS